MQFHPIFVSFVTISAVLFRSFNYVACRNFALKGLHNLGENTAYVITSADG